eukprot:1184778-Prorocentrum_minimum.AAC.4
MACTRSPCSSASVNGRRPVHVVTPPSLPLTKAPMLVHRGMRNRARHGHCRIDRQDLVKPPYHSSIQFSHQFLNITLLRCTGPPVPITARVHSTTRLSRQLLDSL